LALPIPAVNLYNACSMRNVAPMGAYDVARLPGSKLDLRLANPDADRFDPLGSDAAAFPLNDKLIVYAVGGEIMCWG
jgi:DNA/RNA-binding domain of Phe-tRNA-synthetase-like protein